MLNPLSYTSQGLVPVILDSALGDCMKCKGPARGLLCLQAQACSWLHPEPLKCSLRVGLQGRSFVLLPPLVVYEGSGLNSQVPVNSALVQSHPVLCLLIKTKAVCHGMRSDLIAFTCPLSRIVPALRRHGADSVFLKNSGRVSPLVITLL